MHEQWDVRNKPFTAGLTNTVCDLQLFQALKGQYAVLRRWWQRLCSFKTVTCIQFVRFELHRKALVDIRKIDDIPPPIRQNEYRYNPIPTDVIPPIGKNFLMHLYHHPEDADQDTICLSRFPKMKNQRLQIQAGSFSSRRDCIG
jgi:hypothetical protein